jgi:hypothetical protein
MGKPSFIGKPSFSFTAAAALALLVPLALAGSSAAAGQRPVVPPENSAATQYTEAYPTAGGDSTPHGSSHSPGRVLGRRDAKQLEAAGPEGKAAAEVAAATAPSAAAPPRRAPGSKRPGGSGASPRAGAARGGGQDGSSGLGEVLGQATGASSGGMGVLLPLIVLGALAWSGAYAWRRRRRGAG